MACESYRLTLILTEKLEVGMWVQLPVQLGWTQITRVDPVSTNGYQALHFQDGNVTLVAVSDRVLVGIREYY